MSYPNITDINMSSGLGAIIGYVDTVSNGLFGILLLLAIGIITGTNYYKFNKDGAGSFAVGSFITLVMAILFRTAGIISNPVLYICIGITIITVLWVIIER